MESTGYTFQISGIKIQSQKGKLIRGILMLDGKYIGGSIYHSQVTHLIVSRISPSEKFLAACAAGKWVVTPQYVLDSVESGSWLSEEPYEVALSPGSPSAYYPARWWRETLLTVGGRPGAFQGWKVLLLLDNSSREAMFKRILRAGNAKVYVHPPPSHVAITHVMTKPGSGNLKEHGAPCFPITHIVQHLFGDHCVDFGISVEDCPTETDESDRVGVDFKLLETEVKEYIIKQEERTRLMFPEFIGYHDHYHLHSQIMEVDFGSVGCMIECQLFIEALDSIKSSLSPGLLPLATHLVSLMETASQGDVSPLFLRNLQQVLHKLLQNNPPWLFPGTIKKYFTQVLQCPQCKKGLWPFLESTISYCLSSEDTCHPLPGPALPSLLRLHSNLLAFVLKFFQGELHAITTGNCLRPDRAGLPQFSASSSLLFVTFWTVWERSTLLSRAVKQLSKLLVQASLWEQAEVEEIAETDARRDLGMVENLLDMLSVLVEFWCQQHLKLNQNLVEKGLEDLGEHLAAISQDVPPPVLVDLVARVPSTRLKLVTADAIFRHLCCRNGFTVGDEPLSFKKMVSSYLPALGRLGGCPRWEDHRGPRPRTEPVSPSWTSSGKDSGIQGRSPNETTQGKENVPRGLRRVNAAGETLLHRACKRNQVETVAQILALPGFDVNVKDHAGWTPLHEACNHGSAACVEALLRCRPAPRLDNEVNGVRPLHDALLNGHVHIAKMLLEHAGSVLLQYRGPDGRSSLDLVSSPAQRAELLLSAQRGDTASLGQVRNLPLLEAGSSLLAHLLVSYVRERGPPVCEGARGLGSRLTRALVSHPVREVTRGWRERRAARLVEDVEALVELGRAGEGCLQIVSQGVKGGEGESTSLLMGVLDELRARGAALGAKTPPS